MAIRLTDTDDLDDSSRSDTTNTLVQYDASTDKFSFVEVPLKDYITKSVEDSDLPDDFMTTLEGEVNVFNVGYKFADGGTF